MPILLWCAHLYGWFFEFILCLQLSDLVCCVWGCGYVGPGCPPCPSWQASHLVWLYQTQGQEVEDGREVQGAVQHQLNPVERHQVAGLVDAATQHRVSGVVTNVFLFFFDLFISKRTAFYDQGDFFCWRLQRKRNRGYLKAHQAKRR